MDAAAAMAVLRDHDGDDYRPDGHFLGNRVCAHAGNGLARKATQTTASLVAHLPKEAGAADVLGHRHGRALHFGFQADMVRAKASCPTWVPNRANGSTRSRFGGVTRGFTGQCFGTIRNRLRAFKSEREEWERDLPSEAERVPVGERVDFTARAFAEADRKTAEWLERVRGLPVSSKPGPIYRSFWKKQNRTAKYGDTIPIT